MKCIKCNRPLASVSYYWNGEPIGPTCVRRVGKITKAPKQARKKKAQEVERDLLTMDLFGYENEMNALPPPPKP